MDFQSFKLAVQRQFTAMRVYDLFSVDIDKDELWQTYLSSFPEGTNPIYKERTEHDCQCCRQFIRSVGNMVAIIDGKVVSLWDITVGGSDNEAYQTVADALSKFVKAKSISNIFLHESQHAGTDKSSSLDKSGELVVWNHFYLQLPIEVVCSSSNIGTKLGEARTTKEVMLRSLTELTDDSVDTVLDLIAQNSLYKGEENKFALLEFKKLKAAFNKATNKDLFCWSRLKTTVSSVARIRGTAIGTLLVDLSAGVDLDQAVASFESKVAPANYKRPTAVVTKAMIEKAKQTIVDLGLANSLTRRYAVLEDISATNVLFADRSTAPRINDVFDAMLKETPKTVKNLDKVEEVTIDHFISKILPTVSSLEIMVENSHVSNFMSLVAPVDMTAKTMFKWDNGFSWSYNGDVADSIKERVKKAGGKVDGDLRCSLSWFNYDDLDLHMFECGHSYEIFYCNRGRKSPNGGTLDVDMNAGGGHSRTPVENICYSDRKTMKTGIYTLSVTNYSKRETKDIGFEVEVEFDGTIHTFNYNKALSTGASVEVAQIEYNSKTRQFKILKSLPSKAMSKTVWSVKTQEFHKVNLMMLSPNYWDGHGVGNKHYFFMLEGCKNDGTARGFFNEFLNADLDKHRKVLEIVGAKMRANESDDQLSGLGFSSTQRNSVLCRITGTFSRIIKINF